MSDLFSNSIFIFPLLFRLLEGWSPDGSLNIARVETLQPLSAAVRHSRFQQVPLSAHSFAVWVVGVRHFDAVDGTMVPSQNRAWVDEHLFSFGVFISNVIVIYPAGLYGYTSTHCMHVHR